jgi:phosphoribosyl-ATP pyrophosphohydrolase/phosphoribosyl-AMP cyclohydrolase
MQDLKFDKDGLIPAIIQDYHTKRVLMMAYMNKESLDISIKEGRACFYSRSRGEIWRKCETSGNIQNIAIIYADCDNDTLLVEVIPAGPACHTGEVSCFFNKIHQNDSYPEFSLEALYDLIVSRKTGAKVGSYTKYLFDKGTDKILKKIGEESAEVIIAGKGGNREEIIYEIADLTYHALVLMAQTGITPGDIFTQLADRYNK